MGTGAVYVTLAGLQEHYGAVLRPVETVFFFFNLVLFLLNNVTLFLQLLRESRIRASAAEHQPESHLFPQFIQGKPED